MWLQTFTKPQQTIPFSERFFLFPQATFSNGFNIVDIVDTIDIVEIVGIVDSVERVRYIVYYLSHGAMVGKSCHVAGQVSGAQTAWLLFTTPTSSTSNTVCAVCVSVCICVCVCCICVCVCVCVEITVLTKATVSGSVGPVYRRDFLAPRRARCSEPYVPSKLHFLLGSWVWWRRWSRRRSSRWSSRWRSWWKRRRATTVRRARRLFSSSNSVSYASPMKKTRLAPLTLLCEHFCAIHISVEISP